MIDVIREFAEPSKRFLLAELKTGPKSVTELCEATGLKQPNVSNHLAKMKDRGIVRSSKAGRQVYYSLASAEVAEAVLDLSPLTEAGVEHILPLDRETTLLFAKAATAGDEAECTRIVDHLVRQGESLVAIYHRLFADTLHLVGKWWEVEAINVGQEHLASAIVERLMSRVLHYATPAKPSGKRAVVGCCPGNWHSIGIRMISDVMRISGWTTYFLGANVPIDSFVATVREHQPFVVLASCPVTDLEPACLELIHRLAEYRNEGHDFLIGAGGRVVNENPERYKEAGADFTAPDLVRFTDETLPWLDEKVEALA